MSTGPEVADVFRRHGDAYRRAHDGRVGRIERRVMSAIEQVTANPALHTRDLGGTATTAQVTQAMCELLGASAQRKAA